MRRRMPLWTPGADMGLLWNFDCRNQGALKTVDGGPIADGAQLYDWDSLGSKATRFSQYQPAKPVWRQDIGDGLPGVAFSNSPLILSDVTGLTSLAGLTIVAVASSSSNSSAIRYILEILRSGGGAGRAYLTNLGSEWHVGGRRLDTDPAQGVPVGSMIVNRSHIIAVSYDYQNARIRGWLDGILRLDMPFQTPGLSPATNPQQITLGTAHSGLHRHYGNIRHVMAWPKAMSPSDFVGPLHYLRREWRIEPIPGDSTGLMGLPPPSEPPPGGP